MTRELVAVAALVMAGCREQPKRAEAAAQPPVAVRTVAVVLEEQPATYEATGTVHARVTTVLASKVMGYVQQVNAQAGDRVRQGQLLVVLDARDLDAGYRRAEAGTVEVRSAVPEAEQGVVSAKAQLDLAQATFRRMDDLRQKKSISDQEFDEASARLRSAQAGYEMARARRTQLDAKMTQADQELRAAAIQRDYSRLVAPFSGVVTARSVEPGSLASPGVPLLTVEREGGYRLEAAVEESRLAGMRIGQTVELDLAALGRNLTGRISEIVPAIDAASRTAIVKIDLPASPEIRSGLFGRALFPAGSRKALTVPAEAVVTRGQLQSVYVVESGAARNRLVTVGSTTGGRVEVLSGLTAGEAVVAPVPPALSDGARVEARP